MILRTGKTNLFLSRKGFTLVELMVSVVILGFGLDIIIRSYFSVLRGMDISRDYIEAARFSRQKIDALEVASYENNGLLSQSESGRIKLASREFNWQAEVKEIPQPEYLAKELVLVSVDLNWQEGNVAKNSTLVTYLPKHKEKK